LAVWVINSRLKERKDEANFMKELDTGDIQGRHGVDDVRESMRRLSLS